MFDFLKPKKKADTTEYAHLIDSLQSIVYDSDLEDIFYSAESRITLIATYSENISELVDRTYMDKLGPRIIAINLFNYLRNTTAGQLKAQLNKLITYLSEPNRRLNAHCKSDILEIIQVYTLLKKG